MNLGKVYCWFESHDWEEVYVVYGQSSTERPKFAYSRCIRCGCTKNHRSVDESLGKIDFSELDL